jgi:hypothetical protein
MGYFDPEIALRSIGLLPDRPKEAPPINLAEPIVISGEPAQGPPAADPLAALLASKAQQGRALGAPPASANAAPPGESAPGAGETLLRQFGWALPGGAPLSNLVADEMYPQRAVTGAGKALGAGGLTPDEIMVPGGGGGGHAAAPAPARMGGGGGGAPGMIERDLLSPTQRKEYERGMAMERAAATQGAERIHQQLAGQEAMAHDHERDLQAQEAGRMRAEQTRADELRYRQQDYDDAVQQAAKFKIDPNRSSRGGAWFGDMISILLTGIGGKPEVALDQIDKRINRDIDAQRAEYQALRDKAGGAQNAYGMAMQRFGDARAADKVARDALAQQYGAQLQRSAIGMKNAEAENAAQKMLADLQSKYAADTLQFLKNTPTGGGAPSMKLPDLPTDRATQMPDGSWVIAPNHDTKKNLDTRLEGLAEMNASMAEVKALRAKLGLGEGPAGLGFVGKAITGPLEYSANRDALVAAQNRLTLASKKAGMSSDKDFEVLHSLSGNVLSANPNALRPMEQMHQRSQAEVSRYMQQNFFQAAPHVGMMPNPKTGLPEPKYVPGGQATPYGLQQAKPGVPGSFTPPGGKR